MSIKTTIILTLATSILLTKTKCARPRPPLKVSRVARTYVIGGHTDPEIGKLLTKDARGMLLVYSYLDGTGGEWMIVDFCDHHCGGVFQYTFNKQGKIDGAKLIESDCVTQDCNVKPLLQKVCFNSFSTHTKTVAFMRKDYVKLIESGYGGYKLTLFNSTPYNSEQDEEDQKMLVPELYEEWMMKKIHS